MPTQPCDPACAIDHVSSVAWIPAPFQKPIQRALIGSGGPGGMMWPASDPAHALLGTCQDGSICLSLMRYSPAGVSSPAWPTAIGYVLASLSPRKRRRVNV